MDGHEVGVLDDLLEGGEPDSEGVGDLLGKEGIVSDHGHVECLHTLGDLSSDTADTDDSQCLSVELDSGVLGPLPLAPVHGLVCERDVPCDCQEHCAGVLGCGQDVRRRSVHDQDSLIRGVGHVDVVDTYSGTADDAELLSSVDDLLGHLGSGPDDESIIVPDLRAQLVLSES